LLLLTLFTNNQSTGTGRIYVPINAQKKQRLERSASRIPWTNDETELFKASVEHWGKGKWKEIKDDGIDGRWGAKYGKTRSNVHLKDRARTLRL